MDVADLRMHESMQKVTVYQHATTDACANGDIDERVHFFTCAPEIFAQDSRIHIGVKTDRHTQSLPQSSNDVCALPTRLGCRRDVSISTATGIEIYRTKTADPNGLHWAMLCLC